MEEKRRNVGGRYETSEMEGGTDARTETKSDRDREEGPEAGAVGVRALPLPWASFARVMMTNSSVRSRGLRWCCSSYMTKLKWFRDRATRVSLATSAFM